MSGFNNFNSPVINQVIGTLNINTSSREEIARFIDTRLADVVRLIQADQTATRAEVERALRGLYEAKGQLKSSAPSVETIERSLSVAANFASVATLVDQIRPFLAHLL